MKQESSKEKREREESSRFIAFLFEDGGKRQWTSIRDAVQFFVEEMKGRFPHLLSIKRRSTVAFEIAWLKKSEGVIVPDAYEPPWRRKAAAPWNTTALPTPFQTKSKRKNKPVLANKFRRIAMRFLGINGLNKKNDDMASELCVRFKIGPCLDKWDRYEKLIHAMSGHEFDPEAKAANNRRQESKSKQQKIDDFYASWEWKRVRYDVLKVRGRRCECCGATPDTGAKIVVDHIKPVRHYWAMRFDPANLQILCDDCNMGKGSRDETDWRRPDPIDVFLATKVDPTLN